MQIKLTLATTTGVNINCKYYYFFTLGTYNPEGVQKLNDK